MKRPPKSLSSVRELRPLSRLTSPKRVQDFLDTLPINKERWGETCSSPVVTLRRRSAHCMEGALIAALAIWMHGGAPMIMDLKTTDDDVDHLVALFRKGGYWGGITKTNHSVLRYREPMFRDLRELAASYFHEYSLPNGKKTLRAFSDPFDLRSWDGEWITAEEDLWDLERAIDRSPHHRLLTRGQIAGLRKADAIEIRAGKIVEW
jgi:hypothetical protein